MIRHHVREGEPVAQVARRFSVSRQTVYNQLRRDGTAAKPRCAKASKLDRFKDYLRARLKEFDLPATTLFREIKEQGFTGGLTIVKDFVRGVKGELVRDVTERFETLPGRQAQVDWGECGLIFEDGRLKKLYVFVFVLGHSRMLFAKFTTSTKQHVFLTCLKEAFERIGVPRELLIDNLKQAVVRHDKSGVRYNDTFLDFCDHYGTVPVAAPPYWPRVRGKVERGVGYLKNSFLMGRSFTGLADLNAQLAAWLDSVANVRVHGTTKIAPITRYQEELAQLRPAGVLPAYDTRPTELRQVAKDSHLRYKGVAYSVWPRAVGKTVTVRPSGELIGSRFEVYLGSELLATHAVAPRERRMVTLREHAAAIRRAARTGPAKPKRPRFKQLISARGQERPFSSPSVEVRSLALYERLAQKA